MARTLGPILAIGGLALARDVLDEVNSGGATGLKQTNWRIVVGTGIAAMFFALAEKAWPEGAIALAWTALVASLFARLDPAKPSHIEVIQEWIAKAR